MPRKKKNKQKDLRGYATSNQIPTTSISTKPSVGNMNHRTTSQVRTKTNNKYVSSSCGGVSSSTSIVGHSKTRIEMSAKGQLTLTQLLDDLKSKLSSSSTYDSSNPFVPRRTGTDSDTVLIVSTESKQFVKKVTSMNDQLKEIGFNKEQILIILQALIRGQSTINSIGFTMEAALDWSCINMPSKELPTILTEVNLVEEINNRDGGKMASVGGIEVDKTFSQLSMSMNKEKEDTVGKANTVDNIWIPPHVSTTKDESNQNTKNANDEKKSEDEKKKTRAWLLEQYQYEDDGAGEESSNENKHAQDKSTEQAKSPLEKRLEKLEGEIRELRESLQDEAANYMRSKYEIADMKKNLKKMENNAKGLRAKVAKEKAAAAALSAAAESSDNDEETKDVGLGKISTGISCSDKSMMTVATLPNENPENKDDDDEEDEGGLFDMFEIGDSDEVIDTANESADKETAVEQSVVVIPDKPSIPSGWTGKTPKDYLLEHCRKQNQKAKPTFHKRPMNGCKVTVKLPSLKAVIEEESGPCFSYTDAQHFASTRAMYKLAPTLPLYRVFPPVFRDLWKSWIDEKDEKIRNSLQAKDELKKEEILTLINSIKEIGNESTETIADAKVAVTQLHTEVSPTENEWDEDDEDSEEESNVPQHFLSHEGENMRDAFLKKKMDPDYVKMVKIRESLPIHQYRDKIIESVKTNPVTVLCAETGAGKTTQCPQYILEEALAAGHGDNVSIICTQPRRVSAVSVAERVCDEMVERVGDQVGYHIRMESKKSRKTKLLFCTTGRTGGRFKTGIFAYQS